MASPGTDRSYSLAQGNIHSRAGGCQNKGLAHIFQLSSLLGWPDQYGFSGPAKPSSVLADSSQQWGQRLHLPHRAEDQTPWPACEQTASQGHPGSAPKAAEGHRGARPRPGPRGHSPGYPAPTPLRSAWGPSWAGVCLYTAHQSTGKGSSAQGGVETDGHHLQRLCWVPRGCHAQHWG